MAKPQTRKADGDLDQVAGGTGVGVVVTSVQSSVINVTVIDTGITVQFNVVSTTTFGTGSNPQQK